MILSSHDFVSPGIARPSALTDVPNCTTQITNQAPVLQSAFGEGGSLITFPPHVTQYSTNPMTETLSLLPQVRALDSQPSSRRNGKIARLPKETRDMINRMLDDGIPYHVIIDELGEAGEALNTQNLTNWKQGGYQEWSKIRNSSNKPARRPKLPLICCAKPKAQPTPPKLSKRATWSALRSCCT